MNEVLRCLETRRSVRGYRPDAMPSEELISQVVEAGMYAPTGRGAQSPVIVAVTNKAVRDRLSEMNAEVLGASADPFYGAPVVLIVLADKSRPTYLYDGSLVMGNLMNAAHAVGLGSCWIHRAKEVFASEQGKALLQTWGITEDVEGIGFCINLIALCGDYSGIQLVGYSAFQSISAFNNAGFDLFGATSLIAFDDNALLLLNTAFLTIVGGLGFLVINDIFTIRRRKRLAEHTKLVLCITAGLLTLGTVGFLLSELGKIDFLNAFFMSAMTRTCGFTSVDLSQWSNASILLADFLMFIGAGPASTGGGIKCTTFFIVCAAAIAFVRGKPVVIFHRGIGKDLVARCMLITLFAAACVFVAGTCICALDPEYSTAHVFFETISAFANVGLSAGITADLSVGSKVILCLSMYIGRIGFITALMVLRKRWNRGDDETIRCAPAEILVG